MEKPRYLITINWQGEIHKFYRYADSPEQALRHAIRQLAREVGYASKFVRNHVMSNEHRRYEVIIN
jgi:tetrahydromethanopterin S-methyltransferase subunit H